MLSRILKVHSMVVKSLGFIIFLSPWQHKVRAFLLTSKSHMSWLNFSVCMSCQFNILKIYLVHDNDFGAHWFSISYFTKQVDLRSIFGRLLCYWRLKEFFALHQVVFSKKLLHHFQLGCSVIEHHMRVLYFSVFEVFAKLCLHPLTRVFKKCVWLVEVRLSGNPWQPFFSWQRWRTC